MTKNGFLAEVTFKVIRTVKHSSLKSFNIQVTKDNRGQNIGGKLTGNFQCLVFSKFSLVFAKCFVLEEDYTLGYNYLLF